MFRDNFPGSSEVIRKRLLVLIVLPVLLAVSVIAQNDSSKPAPTEAPAGPKAIPGSGDAVANNAAVDEATYIIGPNDVLDIKVFREKDWSGYYQVRTDGMITVSLIGEMRASGLTPKQLQTQLTEALKSQINEPSVTVAVFDVRSKKYTVAGEVRRPGDYPLIKDTTVFEAINAAGGFLDNFANQKDIRILRGKDIFKFNYKDYLNGKNRDKNITLQNGDTVYIK
jgi:polysaccharide export outer membrane protein